MHVFYLPLDTVAPTFSNLPTYIIKDTDAGQPTASVIWTEPYVTDNWPLDITITQDYSPGDNFGIGVTTVKYTAMDNAGNTENYSFNVIIQGTITASVWVIDVVITRVKIYIFL